MVVGGHLIGVGGGDADNARAAEQRIGHEAAPVLSGELRGKRQPQRLFSVDGLAASDARYLPRGVETTVYVLRDVTAGEGGKIQGKGQEGKAEGGGRRTRARRRHPAS
jgi:hypothetical protein